MTDIYIRLEGVEPETWSALEDYNIYNLFLPELKRIGVSARHVESGEWVLLPDDWEAPSGCYGLYDDGPHSDVQTILEYLELLGSPSARLYIMTKYYDGYNDCEEYTVHQLDSPLMKRVEKFNRKLCKALELHEPGMYKEGPALDKGHCPSVSMRLPSTASIVDRMVITIEYTRASGCIYYHVRVRSDLCQFNVTYYVKRLRNVVSTVDKLRAVVRALPTT